MDSPPPLRRYDFVLVVFTLRTHPKPKLRLTLVDLRRYHVNLRPVSVSLPALPAFPLVSSTGLTESKTTSPLLGFRPAVLTSNRTSLSCHTAPSSSPLWDMTHDGACLLARVLAAGCTGCLSVDFGESVVQISGISIADVSFYFNGLREREREKIVCLFEDEDDEDDGDGDGVPALSHPPRSCVRAS